MSFEDRALRRLENLARTFNERGLRNTLRHSVGDRLQRAGVRALDRVVQRVAGHEINTLSDRIESTRPPPRLSQDSTVYQPSYDPGRGEPPLRPSDVEGLSPRSESHGIDRIVLLSRKPSEAFAYWEIDRTRLGSVRPKGAGPMAELRLVDVPERRCVSRTEVPAAQGRVYLELPRSDTTYLAELVLVGMDEEVLLSRSRQMAPTS